MAKGNDTNHEDARTEAEREKSVEENAMPKERRSPVEEKKTTKRMEEGRPDIQKKY